MNNAPLILNVQQDKRDAQMDHVLPQNVEPLSLVHLMLLIIVMIKHVEKIPKIVLKCLHVQN